MSEIEKKIDAGFDEVTVPTTALPPIASPSRRRLIKLGTAAVPIVATLASRPALAWHCQSPSAWGSEQINPNTSLKHGVAHKSYIDETWTINNWKTNTPRTSVDLATGVDAGAPWNELCVACPTLLTIPACNSKHRNKSVFDYTKVTVGHLVTCGFINPGFSTTLLVKDVPTGTYGTQPKTYALIGQLNYAVLKKARFKNDIDSCLRDGQLESMIAGTFDGGDGKWTLTKVSEYLFNNWVVTP
ncbi:hypothetical protein [Rhodoferax sp. UBA5149]|uniref:hypothetical protein n=1 Tax=Rhodoferax sp. UBA5149 TaxID=1947379 RepID=UPI0025FCCCBD|nr:hypothetical protein [Rhodoferax sp. UBA5149]